MTIADMLSKSPATIPKPRCTAHATFPIFATARKNMGQLNTEDRSTPDTTWMDGFRRNDQIALRSIYKAHFPAVRQYVLQNSGTVSDAQDVFQEAIVVLWVNVKQGRFSPGTESGPGGFLFRVAKNKWLDVVRSAAHKHMKVVHNDQALDRGNDAPDDIEERIARLRGVYEKLDDKCRAILDQYYFERKDLATIASGMGVEEDSIRTIKYRCMMKLRAFRTAISGEESEAS